MTACKFKTQCKLFDITSEVCKNNGNYYGVNLKAGCYRRCEECLAEKRRKKEIRQSMLR